LRIQFRVRRGQCKSAKESRRATKQYIKHARADCPEETARSARLRRCNLRPRSIVRRYECGRRSIHHVVCFQISRQRSTVTVTVTQNLSQYVNAEFVPPNNSGSGELRAQDGPWAHLKKQALLKTCSEHLIRATADAARVSDIETGNYACLQGDANAPLILVFARPTQIMLCVRRRG